MRRKKLVFPPRKGFRDTLLKQMPILSQFWYLLFIPILILIPLTVVLFFFTNSLVFIFGVVLRLDGFSTFVKLIYVLFLLLTIFPAYIVFKRRQFKSNHEQWMLTNRTKQPIHRSTS